MGKPWFEQTVRGYNWTKLHTTRSNVESNIYKRLAWRSNPNPHGFENNHLIA